MKKASKFRLLWVFAIVAICIGLIVGSYTVTVAWFSDESVTSNGDIIKVIGTIDLDVTTNFDFYNLALAPDTIYTTDQDGNDIGTYIKTSSQNNIRDVYVRVSFETNRSELSLFFDEGKLTTTTTYTSDLDNKWFYNSADGYYYYLGAVGGVDSVKFNAGYKVDNTLNNAPSTNNAGENVDIQIIVDAIQRPYGAYKSDTDWATAPEVFKDFCAADSGVAWRPAN
ncbi:MAG: hypothetical protein IJW59_01085 [Clostridia bacterium]|nr:hypothetical protein [Clostridia bacterium]